MMGTGYFMEDPREAQRLAQKVHARSWVQRHLTALIEGSESILDVGCGPGTLACAVGAMFPGTRVSGVDISADRLLAGPVVPANVELQQADACRLPFWTGDFDLVYSRFLLEYLQDKRQAVGEMVRVCAQGGHVLLQDLDGQLIWHFPPDPEMEEQLARVLTGLGETGFDVLTGRKLFSIAKAAGLKYVRVYVEPYHFIAGCIDSEHLQQWETKLDIALPTAARILGGERHARDLKARILNYLQRDDTLTYSTIFTVVGQKG